MGERPNIKLTLTTTDKALEIIGWGLTMSIWIWTILSYSELPSTIPIHYNSMGEVDGFSEKVTIITLPLISTILFIGLSILSKFPHVFNYPITITEDNAVRQYTNATRMIRMLKLIIVTVFGIITYETIRIGKGQTNRLGAWFLPLTLGLIYIPLIYFVVKSYKRK